MTNGTLNGVFNSASVFGTDNSSLTRVRNTGNDTDEQDFASVLQNAIIGTLKDTQTLIDGAEQAKIEFALGQSDNTHTVGIAQSKASTAVSYIVAARDRFLEAYKEIMNMQI